MSIVDSAVYVGGKRAENPSTLAETHGTARERGGVVWIGLSRPTEKEFQAVAEEFGLHELAVEDAVVAHQRPKIERYGNTLFVVLKAARYLSHLPPLTSAALWNACSSQELLTAEEYRVGPGLCGAMVWRTSAGEREKIPPSADARAASAINSTCFRGECTREDT